MRIGTAGLLASSMLAVMVAASAEGRGQSAPDPTTAIQQRQQGMRDSRSTMNGFKGAVDGGFDVTSQGPNADRLAAWAASVPGLFPPGSGDGSNALPAVWSDKAGFAAKAAAYVDATAKLAAAAHAGDNSGFASQYEAIQAVCSDCHKSYRKPEAGN